MSVFKQLLSSLDSPAPVAPSAPSPVARLSTVSPKPVQRAPAPSNSASEQQPLKRKASGPIENVQPKLQKKDLPVKPAQANGTARAAPAANSGGVKPASSSSATTVPYRGTAGLGAPKPAVASTAKPLTAKPIPSPAAQPKAPTSASKPAVSKPTSATPSSTSSAPPKKVGGYMAMLQKAKEKDQTKASVPPVKHEPAKIMSKKDRELARLQAKAAAKGKKAAPGLPAKTLDSKTDVGKEKRKPAELGYQGTARPAKKPAEIGYKGTARPNTVASQAGRPGAAKSKGKPKPSDHSRYNNNGYLDWSDVGEDGMDEEEEDYDSDASSDMEGGIWDVEEEESKALKAAKAEDAAALAEEARLKREKEERKRKLLALSKANAAKKRY